MQRLKTVLHRINTVITRVDTYLPTPVHLPITYGLFTLLSDSSIPAAYVLPFAISLLIHIPCFYYIAIYFKFRTISTRFLEKVYKASFLSHYLIAQLLWILILLLKLYTLTLNSSEVIRITTFLSSCIAYWFNLRNGVEVILSFMFPFIHTSCLSLGVSKPRLSSFDVLNCVEAISDGDLWANIYLDELTSKVNSRRSVSLMSSVPTEIAKVLLLKHFLKSYQQQVSSYRANGIFFISMVVAIAISNVQVGFAIHWTHEIDLPWRGNMFNSLTCILVAVCTCAANVISCAAVGSRIAENTIFRQRQSMWNVWVLSFLFCLSVNLLGICSTWTILGIGFRGKALCVLVAIVASTGLFVRSSVNRLLVEEEYKGQEEIQPLLGD